jgi:hypothetical protein
LKRPLSQPSDKLHLFNYPTKRVSCNGLYLKP